jgi:predicted RNase H-like HicB family nuclease
MQEYEIIIYWSSEDDVFVAEVPEPPGCMAHGDTEKLALQNAKEAVQLWIDTALESAVPVPQPKGRRFVYRPAGMAESDTLGFFSPSPGRQRWSPASGSHRT